MSTSTTPIVAGPTDPSPVTPTPNSPRPKPIQDTIPFNRWQPQPIPLSPELGDPIVSACLATPVPHGYYFLDLQRPYELLASPGRNYSLTNLELSGFYNLNGNMVPDSPGFTALFGGREMQLGIWDPDPLHQCAYFTYNIRLDIHTSNGGLDGTLALRSQDMNFSPNILITSAEVTLLPLSPVTTPTPTFGGGLASTVDSSIGQSTNETALPASGNVPVSASSSSSSPKASVIAPAVVVPVVFVLAALAAFFLWRRHRRARLAPSAAFRADNADAVEAMQRQGGTVGLGGTGTSQVPTAGVSLPAQSSSYFPLDEKRPLGP